VASGGSSPALSRMIREELEKYFTEDYAALSELVAEVRRELKENNVSVDSEAWRRALDGDMRRMVREGDIEGAKRYLRERVGF
jgi:precorrin-2 dehydrogenase/sirohydrochlorin ferrochelatase